MAAESYTDVYDPLYILAVISIQPYSAQFIHVHTISYQPFPRVLLYKALGRWFTNHAHQYSMFINVCADFYGGSEIEQNWTVMTDIKTLHIHPGISKLIFVQDIAKNAKGPAKGSKKPAAEALSDYFGGDTQKKCMSVIGSDAFCRTPPCEHPFCNHKVGEWVRDLALVIANRQHSLKCIDSAFRFLPLEFSMLLTMHFNSPINFPNISKLFWLAFLQKHEDMLNPGFLLRLSIVIDRPWLPMAAPGAFWKEGKSRKETCSWGSFRLLWRWHPKKCMSVIGSDAFCRTPTCEHPFCSHKVGEWVRDLAGHWWLQNVKIR